MQSARRVRVTVEGEGGTTFVGYISDMRVDYDNRMEYALGDEMAPIRAVMGMSVTFTMQAIEELEPVPEALDDDVSKALARYISEPAESPVAEPEPEPEPTLSEGFQYLELLDEDGG